MLKRIYGNVLKKVKNFTLNFGPQHSVVTNILNTFFIILEDEKRFSAYYKKKFPRSFKYLSVIKFTSFLLLLITVNIDYHTYSTLFYNISQEESVIIDSKEYYSRYSFCISLMIIYYEYALSIYVIFKANSPIKYALYQVAKHTARAVGSSGVLAVGYSYAPVEPTRVSNFVHTKTPFGRGYDYEIGSFGLKFKGDLVAGYLGKEDMISAVEKHAPDSRIIDIGKLNDIITDPEYNAKIRANTTISEKVMLGIPLIDLSINLNSEGSAEISENTNDLPETNDDNTDYKSTTTPVIKKSPIRKHHSEPLPRRSNRPVIKRRNTH